MSVSTGREQYWHLVMIFPNKNFILSLPSTELTETGQQSTLKHVTLLFDKLTELAKQFYYVIKKVTILK